MKALLRAKANTELLDNDGLTALRRAEDQGHAAIAKLLRPVPPTATPASRALHARYRTKPEIGGRRPGAGDIV